jgi:hypothetical protein
LARVAPGLIERGLDIEGYIVIDVLGGGQHGTLYIAKHQVTQQEAIVRQKYPDNPPPDELIVFRKESKSLLPSATEISERFTPDGRVFLMASQPVSSAPVVDEVKPRTAVPTQRLEPVAERAAQNKAEPLGPVIGRTPTERVLLVVSALSLASLSALTVIFFGQQRLNAPQAVADSIPMRPIVVEPVEAVDAGARDTGCPSAGWKHESTVLAKGVADGLTLSEAERVLVSSLTDAISQRIATTSAQQCAETTQALERLPHEVALVIHTSRQQQGASAKPAQQPKAAPAPSVVPFRDEPQCLPNDVWQRRMDQTLTDIEANANAMKPAEVSRATLELYRGLKTIKTHQQCLAFEARVERLIRKAVK